MAQKDNILDELKGLNSTIGSNRENPFTVPPGYFDGLAGQVLCKIRALENADARKELEILSPMLNGMSRILPYQVPAGYFEKLDPSFATIDTEKELETISPLLSGLKKKVPYSVPVGYFEQLNSSVIQKKPAKTVRLNWARYAAAAVVTGLIVLAAFYFRSEKETGVKVLAKITRDVKTMDETQKDNLLDFVEAGMTGDETTQVSADTKSTIKNLIQDVSDEELRDFQEQTEDIQDVLMTN